MSNIISKFEEHHPHEQGLSEYYSQNLRSLISIEEAQRSLTSKLVKRRAIVSLVIILLAVIISAILTFGDIGKYYHLFAQKFDHIFASYHDWWIGHGWFLKFILPSKIIWWKFPSPIFFTAILFVYLMAKIAMDLLGYRKKKLKEYCIMPLLRFMGDFKFNDKIDLMESDFYDALIFPEFNYAIFAKGCYQLDYNDVKLTVSELDLTIDMDEVHNFRTPVAKSILAICDFGGFDLGLQSRNIIISNKNKDLHDKSRSLEFHKNLGNISICSEIEGNLANEKLVGLARILEKYDNIINKYNRYDTEIMLDEKIANRFNKYIPPMKEFMVDNSLQYGIFKNHVYFVVPINRDLFATGSLFTPQSFDNDIHLVLASVNMFKEAIDYIKNAK